MKRLKDVLYKTGIAEVVGSTDIGVVDICTDSRKVSEGSLFIAVKGTLTDGHDYIFDVINKGAVAIICEKMPDDRNSGITYVRVNDSAAAVGRIAANFYGNPSESLKLVGVTGTNGKTTTVTLLYELFRKLNFKTGLLSTVVNKINDKIVPATHTTPDPIRLNELLAEMVSAGCTYAFMEVSSHAVVQKRIEGIEFAGAVFTNITHDHLDYHKTFDNYLKAKKGFFDGLSSDAFALINTDDRNASVMVQNTKAKKYTYGLKSMADFKCRLVENDFTGLMLNIDGSEVLCRLVGSFNAYNLTAAYATAVLLKQDKINVLAALSILQPVEGRFDFIRSSNNVVGIVDYAHTPDALENVLDTIKNVNTGRGRVITIVGCGGDRDMAKRPVMAKIACQNSDKVILTSDNPRSESPEAIIKQMENGVPASDRIKTMSIVDRKEAIKAAVAFAMPGDIILVAGKGHEKYQEVNGVRTPFDDKQILSELFNIMV